MPEEFLDRTQPPTPRRQEEVKQKGIASRSRDLTIACLLLCALLMYYYLFERISIELQAVMTSIWSNLNLKYDSVESATFYLREGLLVFTRLLFIPFSLLALLGLFFNLLQTGVIFTAYPLKPRWNNVNPFTSENYNKFFNSRTWFKFFLGLIKIAAVIYVTWMVMKGNFGSLYLLPTRDVPTIVETIFHLALSLSIILAGIYFALGLIDLGFQKWKFWQDLKMSPQEIKEEQKQAEGNLQWKSHIEAILLQWTSHRFKIAVPKADVVISSPSRCACAIRYDSKMMLAPICIVRGSGKKADMIVDTARINQIPVIENPALAEALYHIKEGAAVPPAFYFEVASILSRNR